VVEVLDRLRARVAEFNSPNENEAWHKNETWHKNEPGHVTTAGKEQCPIRKRQRLGNEAGLEDHSEHEINTFDENHHRLHGHFWEKITQQYVQLFDHMAKRGKHSRWLQRN